MMGNKSETTRDVRAQSGLAPSRGLRFLQGCLVQVCTSEAPRKKRAREGKGCALPTNPDPRRNYPFSSATLFGMPRRAADP